MCGIAGHVASADAGRDPREAQALVRAMTDALHHRGPDASGVHQQRARGARARAPGDHRSVDRREPADAERRRAGRRWCSTARSTTSAELAAELRDAGVQLRTRSDTEVLLELYRLHGLAFVRRCAACSRSRSGTRPGAGWCWGAIGSGKKPLFFHVGKRGLSFASELQALLADGDIERRADPRGAARLPGARLRAVRVRRHRGRAQAGARHHRRVRGRQAGGGALLEPAVRAAAALGGRLRRGAARATCSRRSKMRLVVGRPARGLPVGRHRFVRGGRDHERGRREAGQDVLDRLRREGLLRGDLRAPGGARSTRPITTRRCCARTPPSCCPSWCTPTASRSPIRRRCRRTCCRR